jgi:hypothetical protein
LGVVWGKVRGRENHTLLPQFRTVCETVWGLGLNPCGESLGPCGEDDGSKGESGRGIPSTSLDPPAIALLRSAYAIRRRIWGWVEGVRGKRRTRQTHLSYLGPRNGQDFRGGAECGGRRPRGAAKKEEEEGVEGGGRRDHRKPFPPHGLEGLAMVGTREKRAEGSSPRGNRRGENLREDISTESSRTSPHVRQR